MTDESRKCNIINVGCGSIQSGREETQERIISQKKAVMKVPSENLLLCMLFFKNAKQKKQFYLIFDKNK